MQWNIDFLRCSPTCKINVHNQMKGINSHANLTSWEEWIEVTNKFKKLRSKMEWVRPRALAGRLEVMEIESPVVKL